MTNPLILRVVATINDALDLPVGVQAKLNAITDARINAAVAALAVPSTPGAVGADPVGAAAAAQSAAITAAAADATSKASAAQAAAVAAAATDATTKANAAAQTATTAVTQQLAGKLDAVTPVLRYATKVAGAWQPRPLTGGGVPVVWLSSDGSQPPGGGTVGGQAGAVDGLDLVFLGAATSSSSSSSSP